MVDPFAETVIVGYETTSVRLKLYLWKIFKEKLIGCDDEFDGFAVVMLYLTV